MKSDDTNDPPAPLSRVRQGFIAERELMKPIKRLHDPSLSRGRTVVALRKLSARHLARRQTAHLSNHQKHHYKVTRVSCMCECLYENAFFSCAAGCEAQIWDKNEAPHRHMNCPFGLGSGMQRLGMSWSGPTIEPESRIQTLHHDNTGYS